MVVAEALPRDHLPRRALPPSTIATMGRGRTIAEFVHLLALALWLGSLGIAAFAAGGTFRIMRELDPALPGYAGFEGAHWSIAAGQVVVPLFVVVDIVQFVCILLAGSAFAAAAGLLGLSLRRISTFLRAFLLLALIAILSYRFFALQPEMAQHLLAYWSAAGRAETELALQHKALFDQGHTLDRNLMMATALLLLASIIAAFWSILDTRPLSDGRGQGGSELQIPQLARR